MKLVEMSAILHVIDIAWPRKNYCVRQILCVHVILKSRAHVIAVLCARNSFYEVTL